MSFEESKNEFRVLRGTDTFKLGLQKGQYAWKSLQGVLTDWKILHWSKYFHVHNVPTDNLV